MGSCLSRLRGQSLQHLEVGASLELGTSSESAQVVRNSQESRATVGASLSHTDHNPTSPALNPPLSPVKQSHSHQRLQSTQTTASPPSSTLYMQPLSTGTAKRPVVPSGRNSDPPRSLSTALQIEEPNMAAKNPSDSLVQPNRRFDQLTKDIQSVQTELQRNRAELAVGRAEASAAVDQVQDSSFQGVLFIH